MSSKLSPEERTAPYCGRCKRILRNDSKRGDQDTVTGHVEENKAGDELVLAHDGCGGGRVAGSWREVHE